MSMTLKQLEAFYWAATCGSFAIAATRLHLSQSSLSKRIAELEESLSCPLFDRSGHRSVLTAAGESLLPRARALLSASEDIIATIGKETAVKGRCRFGTGEIAASSWLPRFVVSVKKNYPELSLEPYVEMGRDLEQKLIDGELDFALIAKKSSHPSIQSELIAQVEFDWIVAAGQPCPAKNPVRELTRMLPVISMHKNAGTNQVLERWQRAAGWDDLKILTCNNMSAMAGLVAAGLGISYFPKGWVAPLVEKNIVKAVYDREPLQKLDYYFQWRADDKRLLIQGMKKLILENVNYELPILML
jgi:DNA-binding transcriptional LysR family regulator